MSSQSEADWRTHAEAQVRTAFERYEQALHAHAVEALNDFFVPSEQTVRFGIAEESYGATAIAAYRRSAPPVHPQRQTRHTVVTALTAQVACVTTEFTDLETPGLGRQSQTWLLTAQGWKIALAHVSLRRVDINSAD